MTSKKKISQDQAVKVYSVVQQIPPGKVSTYGDIAKWLNFKSPRQVGWILHRNPSHSQTPCHRVVFSDGRLSGQFAFGGADAQRKWLENEGVVFIGEKVDMKKSRWKPEEKKL